jgi:hypothetical protein
MENENIEPQVEEEILEEEETTQELEQQEIPDDSIVLKKADFNKLNRKAIAYESTKNRPKQESPVNNLDSVDLIKLGKKLQDYSDEELDFVTEFAKSKKPNDILKALENPFVKQGITAAREKSEKEKLSVKPSGTQPEMDAPSSLAEKLANAYTIADKQKILEEYGLYSEPKNNPNRVIIRQ